MLPYIGCFKSYAIISITLSSSFLFSLTLKIRSKTDIKNSNKTIDGEIIEKEKDDT